MSEHEQALRQQQEMQQHSQNLGSGAGHKTLNESVLEELTDTPLSEGSKEILRNLTSKDFVLANFSNAEVNEVKWTMRIHKELFFAMHPDDDCLVTGDIRAAINDDPSDTLEPLSQEERMVIHTFFSGLETRPTRAKDMKQQELLNTEFRESRVANDKNSDTGGLLGRLKR